MSFGRSAKVSAFWKLLLSPVSVCLSLVYDCIRWVQFLYVLFCIFGSTSCSFSNEQYPLWPGVAVAYLCMHWPCLTSDYRWVTASYGCSAQLSGLVDVADAFGCF